MRDPEAHQGRVDAARAAFRESGLSPQIAALGDWEQQVSELNGEDGPSATEEAGRGPEAFLDAERAAREASGSIPNTYLRVDGVGMPECKEYISNSAVLNWRQQQFAAA